MSPEEIAFPKDSAAAISPSFQPTGSLDRGSPKRKFDACGEESNLNCVRMKRGGEDHAVGSLVSSRASVPSTSLTGADDPGNCSLHFFVRMITDGKTLAMHANPEDSVQSVHERIQLLTGISVCEQRLIDGRRQLHPELSLAECSVGKDSLLHLVGRMKGTVHPLAWQLANAAVDAAIGIARGSRAAMLFEVRRHVHEFLRSCPMDRIEGSSSTTYLQVFRQAGATSALVMLFSSPTKSHRDCAAEAIRLFVSPNNDFLPRTTQIHCAPIVLELCQLLSKAANKDPLYMECRNTLGLMLESIGTAYETKLFDGKKELDVIRDLFPFVSELAGRISSGIMALMCEPLPVTDLRDFSAVLLPLRRAIMGRFRGLDIFPIPVGECGNTHPCCEDEIQSLHNIFLDLLNKTDEGLKYASEHLDTGGSEENASHHTSWCQYLAIMKELNAISELYADAKYKIHAVLRARRSVLNAIIRHVKRGDDHLWFLGHKDIADFESKRHLLMMLLPDVKEFEELHEMLIDRSHILSESFEYIGRAEASALHGGLFMEFKNEEATGPGVLREWFCLVCKALFDPQNALFLSCPNDRRRFYPNPASRVDPLHLDYFSFCGRVVALALMHKVQIGIVFDRVFFQQLAGNFITLEDIKDADPYLYTSCKHILEMDANVLDSDALTLTFVSEVDELGSHKIVELCCGGKDIVVNSSNREEYVNLLIQYRFVFSISDQVAHFAQGFADILCDSELQQFFFSSLELDDLNRMLHGTERAICVNDWKKHTEYSGYEITDHQICWFWKVVEGLSAGQQRVLLFFWTSVNHLPVEGFGGLSSKLYIFKTSDKHDRLPSSHTCFYRLCLPPYPSLATMRDRLSIITQEHIGCSFGMW